MLRGDSGPRQHPEARSVLTARLCWETQPSPGQDLLGVPAELRASAPPASLLLPWPQNILFSPFSEHTSTGAARGCDMGMWLPKQPPEEQRLSVWAAAGCSAPGVQRTQQATAVPPHLKNPWKCPVFSSELPHGCSRVMPTAPVTGVQLPPVRSQQLPRTIRRRSRLSPSSHSACCRLATARQPLGTEIQEGCSGWYKSTGQRAVLQALQHYLISRDNSSRGVSPHFPLP